MAMVLKSGLTFIRYSTCATISVVALACVRTTYLYFLPSSAFSVPQSHSTFSTFRSSATGATILQ
ncbi:hypothetical protein D9M69_586280 [compost metagenome]